MLLVVAARVRAFEPHVRIPLAPPASLGYCGLPRTFPESPGVGGLERATLAAETLQVEILPAFTAAVSVWRICGSVSLLTG